jgi:hypothetical protein
MDCSYNFGADSDLSLVELHMDDAVGISGEVGIEAHYCV